MTSLANARDIVRGVIASFLGFGGRLLARAILMIFAGHVYGIEALGRLGQVAAITEVSAAICVIGLKRSLLDMLSFEAELGKGPERRTAEALGVAIFLSVIVGFALSIVWWFLFPSHHNLLPILFLAVPAIVISDVSLTAIKYERVIRWDVWAKCIVDPWVFLFLVIAFWSLGWMSTGLIIAYVGAAIGSTICAVFGLSRVMGLRALMSSRPKITAWLPIIRQSAPIGITDIGIMALRRADLIVLSLFVGPHGTGLYYLAQQLVTIPHKISGMFEPMLSPVMASLHNQRRSRQIQANLMSVCRWVFTFQLALSIPMIVFSGPLLMLFGSDFSAGALVLSVLLIAELVDGTFLSVETPLVYARPKIPPTLLVLAIIIEVLLIALLSSIFGAVGAAWGYLFTIVFLTAGRLVMLRQTLGINVINNSYLIPLIAGLGMSAILVTLRQFEPVSPVIIGFAIVAALLGFAGIIKTYSLSKSDRILIRALSRRRKRTVQ